MTSRTRNLPIVLPFILLVVLTGAACRGIAGPQGWAAPVDTPSGIITSLHKGKLSLTDPTGKEIRWQFPPATDKKTNLQGVYGTPVVTDKVVVFGGFNGHIYALQLEDGKQLWDVKTSASIIGSPAINGDSVYVGNSDGKLLALNLANGNQRWQFDTGERIWSQPVVDGSAGAVYVTCMNRKVYALALDTGKTLWTDTIAGGAIVSTPDVNGGRLYFGAFDKHVYAVEQQSGNKIWQSAETDNWLWAQPLLSDSGDTVYTGGLGGNVYSFDARTGAMNWSTPAKFTDAIRGRPALAQGVLVVADRKGHVEGLDPANGKSLWSADLNSTSLGDLVLSTDKRSVLAVTEGGTGGSRLVQIDPTNGTVTVLSTA